jgi:signal recognition particle subunit SRP68
MTMNPSTSFRVLQLYLFEAERCLTTSNQIQSLLLAQPPNPSRLKRDQISKLRKASSWLSQLLSLVSFSKGKVDHKTQAELQSYNLLILSTLSFSKASYGEALPLFLARRRVLLQLATGAESSHEQALAELELDGINPVVRFCAYKLGRKRTGSGDEVSEIDADFSVEELEESFSPLSDVLNGLREEQGERKMGGKKGGLLFPITWAGGEVKVKSPEIVRSLIKVQQNILSLQKALIPRPKVLSKGENRNENQAENESERFKWNDIPLGGRNTAQPGLLKKYSRILASLIEAESVSRTQASQESSSSEFFPPSDPAGGVQTGTTEFVHQWIIYLLLSWRIRRDLILIKSLWQPRVEEVVDTVLAPTSTKRLKGQGQGQSKNLHAQGKGSRKSTVSQSTLNGQKGLTKVKKDSACRGLQAGIKIWDTVLQSLSQMGELGIVLERDEIHRGVKGMGDWVGAIRCLKLAQLHVLLPNPGYESAVHLISRSQIYARQAGHVNAHGEEEEERERDLFYHLRPRDLERLGSQINVLDRGVKRAWFGATNKKPVFFDLAFNYVDLPMEQLERAGGREVSVDRSEEETGTGTGAGNLVDKLPESIRAPVVTAEKVLESAGKTVVSRLASGTGVSRGRESTPAPEMAVEDESVEEKEKDKVNTGAKSGWFGGLFGGRK